MSKRSKGRAAHSWYLQRYPVVLGTSWHVPTYTATVTGPGGTIYQFVNVTFTVSTDVPTPTYTWSVGSGGSIVSGQGTTSLVVRFTGTGSRSVTCDVTGGGTASDTESVTVTAFTPAAFSNLAGWWDFSSASYVTKDGSNLISAVTDRSGNGRGLAQATSTFRPVWAASARNGLGAMQLDNADDLLESSVIAPTNWIGSGTEVTIISFQTWTGGRFGWQLNTAKTGAASRFQLDMAGSTLWAVDNGGTSALVTMAAVSSGTAFLDVLRWKTGEKVSVRRYSGGSSVAYESASTFSTTFSTNMGVFYGRRDPNGLQGNNFESMIFARKLTDAEVVSIKDYIEAKWGAI